MQGREPMRYTQPEAEGSFDHSHQKPSVMQQTQLPQQRTPNHNQKQQVRSITQYTVNSDNAQPMEHQQYTSTFPGLPTTPEPHWQKVEMYKCAPALPETSVCGVCVCVCVCVFGVCVCVCVCVVCVCVSCKCDK